MDPCDLPQIPTICVWLSMLPACVFGPWLVRLYEHVLYLCIHHLSMRLAIPKVGMTHVSTFVNPFARTRFGRACRVTLDPCDFAQVPTICGWLSMLPVCLFGPWLVRLYLRNLCVISSQTPSSDAPGDRSWRTPLKHRRCIQKTTAISSAHSQELMVWKSVSRNSIPATSSSWQS